MIRLHACERLLFELDPLRMHAGYWVSDMQQECYTGLHTKRYVPLALAVLVALSIAPPLLSFYLLYQRRIQLHEIRTRKVRKPARLYLPCWKLLC